MSDQTFDDQALARRRQEGSLAFMDQWRDYTSSREVPVTVRRVDLESGPAGAVLGGFGYDVAMVRPAQNEGHATYELLGSGDQVTPQEAADALGVNEVELKDASVTVVAGLEQAQRWLDADKTPGEAFEGTLRPILESVDAPLASFGIREGRGEDAGWVRRTAEPVGAVRAVLDADGSAVLESAVGKRLDARGAMDELGIGGKDGVAVISGLQWGLNAARVVREEMARPEVVSVRQRNLERMERQVPARIREESPVAEGPRRAVRTRR